MKRRLALALAALATTATTAGAGTLVPGPAHADPAAGPPPLVDAFGLTQVTAQDPLLNHAPAPNTPGNPNVPADTPTDFRITVRSDQVANATDSIGHHIRIVLPSDYNTEPAKRYPVLYLLHGSPGDPCDYFNAYPTSTWAFNQFDKIKNTSGMIIVMPDGGPRSWYSDWATQTDQTGAQNWDTFETGQVVPFIDANLRTIADRSHRAIAGVSMGGFGALHLAARHQDMFSQVAALSGTADLSENATGMVLREVIAQSLSDNVTGATGIGDWQHCQVPTVTDAYAPGVDATSILGPINAPYDAAWNAVDPTQNAAAYANMGVSLYVGGGNLSVRGVEEAWLNPAAHNLDNALVAAGQHPYFVDYGWGAGWGACDGGHDPSCWDSDLADLLPRLQRTFANTGGVGAITVANQGLCLDVRAAAVTAGTPVQVYGCNNTSAQTWTLDAGNTVRAYGKCLDVAGGGTGDGTPVDLYDCNGTGAQQWVAQAGGKLVNPQSGKCLSDANWGGPGTQTVIWDCGGGTDQQWKLPATTPAA